MRTWALTYRLEGSGSQNAHSVLQESLGTTCVLQKITPLLVVAMISDFIEFVVCSCVGAVLPLRLGHAYMLELCWMPIKCRVLEGITLSLVQFV